MELRHDGQPYLWSAVLRELRDVIWVLILLVMMVVLSLRRRPVTPTKDTTEDEE